MHSSNFEALIENPPPKSPYFTLPDTRHLTKAVQTPRKRGSGVSIVILWGPASKMSENHTTDFLLELLKYSQWEPDFQAVADKWGLDSSKIVQKRFKSIVENRKYELEDGMKVTGGKGPPKPEIAALEGAKNDDSKADDEAGGAKVDTGPKKKTSKKRKVEANDEAETAPKKRSKAKDAVANNAARAATFAEQDNTGKSRASKKKAKTCSDDLDDNVLADNADALPSDAVNNGQRKKVKKTKTAGDIAEIAEHDNIETIPIITNTKAKKVHDFDAIADVVDDAETAETEHAAPPLPLKKKKSKKFKEDDEMVASIQPVDSVKIAEPDNAGRVGKSKSKSKEKEKGRPPEGSADDAQKDDIIEVP